jgi:hypothetical protein
MPSVLGPMFPSGDISALEYTNDPPVVVLPGPEFFTHKVEKNRHGGLN